MATIINSNSLSKEALAKLHPQVVHWIYNSFDCCTTREILDKTIAQLDNTTRSTYEFEKSCQAPALEMMLRGILVDIDARDEVVTGLKIKAAQLENILSLYGNALIDEPLKAKSVPQLKKVFYDVLKLPVQYKYDKTKRENVVTTDHKALEALAKYEIANPLVKAILNRRDIQGRIAVLSSGIDADKRMRFSLNVGATETGRWSSSGNAFGGGTNGQNLTEEIRHIFIADPGYKFAYIDLSGAEGVAVATASGDKAYMAALSTGDIHTFNAWDIWPELPWTHDLKADRSLADQPCYRHHSYRDIAKRGGHGTNYVGTARSIAQQIGIPPELMERFQSIYFRKYPGIAEWHKRVAHGLQTTGTITTIFGRKRRFLGRSWDNATLREAVAFEPQSMIADYLNAGMLRVWRWGKVQLLLQVHDAILVQYPIGAEDLLLEAKRLISLPWNGFTCPCDVQVGWNWQHATTEKDLARGARPNLDGLVKWSPSKPDMRTRTRNGAQTSILDWRLP